MKTEIKEFSDLIQDGGRLPTGWNLKVIINDDNLAYLASYEPTREAILVDPMREDYAELLKLVRSFEGYRFLFTMDTHTHADHVSCAFPMARELKTSYLMHAASPSSKAQIRISKDCEIPTSAGPMKFLTTPGHTVDGLVLIWGPFLFGGDTLMYGDTGRDDLPGGNPEAHFESLQKIKTHARLEMFMLPNHDGRGGRISSWKTQLEVNASLTQDRTTFVAEAGAYVGPSPKNLKESLFENCK
ncbi:MAG: hypothetical protein JNL01_15555 [Bdellovibrionales bacterium]|nr:hypothetical protein [Bdellovibrionales bacterium]